MRRWLAGLLLSLLACWAHADTRPSTPFMQVLGTGAEVERLPLLMTTLDAHIVGPIADVHVAQTYENRGQKPIEAVYVFPGSAHAAVYAVTMTIGTRVIAAQIQPKDTARATYESAKSAGRTASLLEQRDANIFQMNVANVLPGDRIKVELRYTELLVPKEGQYEFFFPNTFTERYVAKGHRDIATPTSGSPDVTDFSFGATVTLDSGLSIADIASPSHNVAVSRPRANRAVVALSDQELHGLAKDFVLRYRLGGDAIETGLLYGAGPDANYFALVAQPPLRVGSAQIVPREFVFVVDVSGSMHGKPLEIAQSLMLDLLASLNPGDRFNIVMFSGDSKVLAPGGSLPANAQTAERADAFMHSGFGGGGTELLQALDVAYAIPTTTSLARTVVVITDGEIQSGGEEFKKVREHLGEANLFAFGIGAGVNHRVIENLARGGMGEPFIVENMDEGPAQAARFRTYIDRPVLSRIATKFAGFDAFDVEPQHLPDLLAERPLVLVGKFQGAIGGRIEVSGLAGNKPVTLVIDAKNAAKVEDGDALRYLWARARIDRLLDEHMTSWTQAQDDDADAKKAITVLGLKHSLLTPYTSFVAVTPEVRAQEAAQTVQQPAAARTTDTYGQIQKSETKASPAPAARYSVPAHDSAGADKRVRVMQAPSPASAASPPPPAREAAPTEVLREAAPPPPARETPVPRSAEISAPPPAPPAPPASPAPAPAARISSGGWGSPLSVQRTLAVDLRDRPAPAAPATAQRRVGDKTFVLRNDRWEDVAAKPAKLTIRVRAGSAAFARLVALDVRFTDWAALGQRVRIAFGDVVVEISPEGFSDVSTVAFERLRAALSARH